jgi:hypothetical protein
MPQGPPVQKDAQKLLLQTFLWLMDAWFDSAGCPRRWFSLLLEVWCGHLDYFIQPFTCRLGAL